MEYEWDGIPLAGGATSTLLCICGTTTGGGASVTSRSLNAEYSKYAGLGNDTGAAFGSGGMLGVERCALTERPLRPLALRV